MKLNDIKSMAEIELISVIINIKQVIKEFPEGRDITLRRHGFLVEEECDRLRIPIYHLTGSCYSVAATYINLLEFERGR